MPSRLPVDLIVSDGYTEETYYMGTVDEKNQINFYDGMIRVVDPEGKEFVKYPATEYAQHVAEHVEPWTYLTSWRGCSPASAICPQVRRAPVTSFSGSGRFVTAMTRVTCVGVSQRARGAGW